LHTKQKRTALEQFASEARQQQQHPNVFRILPRMHITVPKSSEKF